jgi:hypothetical protein
MRTNNIKIKLIGLFFILAIIVNIAGGVLIESVQSELAFISAISDVWTIRIGVFLEALNGILVLLIGILIFNYIKNHSKKTAIIYLIARFIEGIICIFTALLALFFINGSILNGFINISQLGQLIELRHIFMNLIIPISFSLSGLVLFYFILKSNILPKYIGIWGLIGTVLIFIMNIVSVPESMTPLFGLPIITNEIYLSFYIIFKGFKV